MSPENKRKRTLSQTSDSSTTRNAQGPVHVPLKCSEDIYFDDGNIVLGVEGIAFRVHRGQLARHSVFFCDMFALAEQTTDGETFRGCPMVRLSDKSKDVLELLRVLYDHVKFDPHNVSQLISIIRLSTKYIIEDIRAAALKVLNEAYPDTLEKYDAYKSFRIEQALIIRLAHEVHTETLLPAAYYALCGKPAIYLLTSSLSEVMWEKLYRGREQLSAKLLLFVQQELDSRKVSNGCTKRSTCREAWRMLQEFANLLLRDQNFITRPNPLFYLKLMKKSECILIACTSCRGELEATINAERGRTWASLPSLFQLGTWEELRQRQ